MGYPAHRAEDVSDIGEQPDESVTGVGVPNVLLVTTRELQRGDVLGARYQIEAVIGTGGSGRVLRAFDREARTPVALKILRPEFAADPVWAERFSRELRIGRSIIHPNVCRVFDIGDVDGHKFLSMELASLGSIRGEVPKIGATRMTPTRPQRPWIDRVADARAVVEGVAALHAAGIIHRDIKPENILRMEDGRVVVTDFGLATDPGANAGNTVMVGTPSYMAPEVVMGDPATARSDVWGLGIVLHEILFGCRPQWKAIGRGYRRFVPPDDMVTPAQRAAAELCGRCADDSPEARPASAVEVGNELARALRGKRRFTRPGRRSAVWGALALASFATLGLIRERWSNRAQASLSGAAAPVTERVLSAMGTPEDWSEGATKLASFAGKVHCLSLTANRRTARVIWGEPRQAEEIGVRAPGRNEWKIPRETFESGCPQTSPDGTALLYDKTVDGVQGIYLSPSPAGTGGKQLVRGSDPRWLANGQEFVFFLDSQHAAIFSLRTRQMTVVADQIGKQFAMEEVATDPSSSHLAILYSIESLGSLLVIHALPDLDVVGRARVPQWSRNLLFAQDGGVRFTAVANQGLRELLSTDVTISSLKTMAKVPGKDIRQVLDANPYRVGVARQIRFDLARIDKDGTSHRLTYDGDSRSGSQSSDGSLAIQRRLPGAREAIVLRDPTGAEYQMTDGPNDISPSFLPDGTAVLYIKLASGEIGECSVASRHCEGIQRDPLIPSFAVPAPAGDSVAYITSLNSPRVRVLSRRTREIRDLGPAYSCAPFWASATRLWVAVSAGASETNWAEIDVDSGKGTGAVRSARTSSGQDACPLPAHLEALADSGSARVVPIVEETAELLRRELN